MNPLLDTETRWLRIAEHQLTGRKIKAVRYMTKTEQSNLGWAHRPVVIELDNGHLIWPSADDEGNDAGAIFTTSKHEPVLPVMR